MVLPAFTAATTVHHGTGGHEEIGPLYGQLARWVEDHGYRAHGPGRDLHLGPYEEHHSNYVKELQLPIQKASL